jgi:hypothetical protein
VCLRRIPLAQLTRRDEHRSEEETGSTMRFDARSGVADNLFRNHFRVVK